MIIIMIIIIIIIIQKMWHLKATVIPVVVGALGMIKRKTEDHIKRIPRIAKDSTERNGSFIATCTIHVTDFTVLTQSED